MESVDLAARAFLLRTVEVEQLGSRVAVAHDLGLAGRAGGFLRRAACEHGNEREDDHHDEHPVLA